MFAYMGPPDRQPPLPPFERLVRGDWSRKVAQMKGRVAMNTVPEDTLLPIEALPWPLAESKEFLRG